MDPNIKIAICFSPVLAMRFGSLHFIVGLVRNQSLVTTFVKGQAFHLGSLDSTTDNVIILNQS